MSTILQFLPSGLHVAQALTCFSAWAGSTTQTDTLTVEVQRHCGCHNRYSLCRSIQGGVAVPACTRVYSQAAALPAASVQQPSAERLQVLELAERGNAKAQRHHSSTTSGEARGAQDTGYKANEVPPLVTKVLCLIKPPSSYLQAPVFFLCPTLLSTYLPILKFLNSIQM
jgi:hypothetical protein